jgi:hypothetical protein
LEALIERGLEQRRRDERERRREEAGTLRGAIKALLS